MSPDDAVLSAVRECCEWSLVARIEPRSGTPFDGVFLVCDGHALIYELWSDDLGMPSGELGLIDLAEIASVREY
jgi:hypothetical protein